MSIIHPTNLVSLLVGILLLLSAAVDVASAQVPARVETPYTLIDAGNRTYIQGGVEAPVRGNGPLTGYAYLFVTRPHFLDKNLYLRLVIPPGYFISELARDHWPSQNSAIGFGVSGGLWADSQVEFRDGRFEKEESFSGHSVGPTLAYYLRGPKLGPLPLEGQIRATPKYVWYGRTDDTSGHFRLPENSAIYDARAGIRLGGVPPELFPTAALELSLWHTVSYRDNAGRYARRATRGERAPHAADVDTAGRDLHVLRHTGERVPERRHRRGHRRAFRVPPGRWSPPARRISLYAARLQRRGDLRAPLLAVEFRLPIPDLPIRTGSTSSSRPTTRESTMSKTTACPAAASPASAPTCRSLSRSTSRWPWGMATASMRRATMVSAGMRSTRSSSSSTNPNPHEHASTARRGSPRRCASNPPASS